jgi:DME family drug/metabolite transporter
MNRKLAPVFVIASGCLWGSMGIFVRRLDGYGLSSMQIVTLRSCIAVLALWIGIACYNRKLLKIRLRDSWIFLASGCFSVVFFNFCYFKSITLTSLSVAAVLLYTAPIFVMLLSAVLFHEKLTKWKLVSLVLAILGCVLVTGVLQDTASVTPLGILLGLGSAVGYALYSVFGRIALMRGYHSLTITAYTFLVSAIGSLLLTDSRGIVKMYAAEPNMLLFSMLFALVTTILPYILYTFGLSGMQTGKASVLASIEPVTATVIGVLCFQERMSWGNALGIVLVLLALVLAAKTEPEEKCA